MIGKVLILLALVSYAVSNSCVRYTFEDNEWLTHEWQHCNSLPLWIIGKYRHLDLTGPNEHSLSYIKPLPDLSCISSFTFPMNLGGTIEVNIYMEASEPFDQIIVLAYLRDIHSDRTTGIASNFAMDPNFVSGWHTMRISLTGAETYDGYITIMGMESPNSTVLVDSFRYIPPSMDEAECRLYEGQDRNNNSR